VNKLAEKYSAEKEQNSLTSLINKIKEIKWNDKFINIDIYCFRKK
jgi:hypothetical protein